MNYSRITITLPDFLYQGLRATVEERGISRFVAQAIEQQLLEKRTTTDPLEEIRALRRDLPNVRRKTILEAIRKGRQ